MNNKVKITVESPLIRPGLKLETLVSMRYVSPTVEELMKIVRADNLKNKQRAERDS